MNFVGVDGCGGGWVAVAFDADGNPRSLVRRFIKEVWDECSPVELMLVDIPIGLMDGGPNERPCDLRARKALGRSRRSSVFRVPCREAVHAQTKEDAERINKERTGKKLSRQTMGIIGKIREVDDFLCSSPEARGRVREIHPEVLFWRLNANRAMAHRKGKQEGFDERMGVLKVHFPDAPGVVEKARAGLSCFKVKDDDIMDALAAAITAWKYRNDLTTIPDVPEKDGKGLPMEMVLKA